MRRRRAVAVREHRALGRPGRARRVDDEAAVLGRDRVGGAASSSRSARSRPRARRSSKVRSASPAGPSITTIASSAGSRRGPARSSRPGRVLADDDAAPRSCPRPTRTPRARGRVDRHHDAAGAGDGEARVRPVTRVLARRQTRSPGSTPSVSRPSAASSTTSAACANVTSAHRRPCGGAGGTVAVAARPRSRRTARSSGPRASWTGCFRLPASGPPPPTRRGLTAAARAQTRG